MHSINRPVTFGVRHIVKSLHLAQRRRFFAGVALTLALLLALSVVSDILVVEAEQTTRAGEPSAVQLGVPSGPDSPVQLPLAAPTTRLKRMFSDTVSLDNPVQLPAKPIPTLNPCPVIKCPGLPAQLRQ